MNEDVEIIEYLNKTMSYVIDEYVHSERDRAILKRKFIDGIHYEPLAEEFKLSVRQTKHIVYKYQDMLFTKLNQYANM